MNISYTYQQEVLMIMPKTSNHTNKQTNEQNKKIYIYILFFM